MTEHDPKISRIYQDLGKEEPPRALDEAILAASRRGTGSRPASLDRASRRRWYAPLAAAAVIVLAVAVTLHVQLEQPQPDAPVPPAPRAEKPAAPPAPVAVEKPVGKKPESRAEMKSFVPDPPPASSEPAERRTARSYSSREEELPSMRDRSTAAEAPRAAAAPMLAKRADAAAETPEKELERIAELRRAGRHGEADKALAEFRKRYPDFKIPEPMLQRVERR